jgi:hypothetical protein
VAARDVQDHLTGPVQTTGAVPVHLAGRPAVLGPRLPDQRRLARIDTDTVDPAVELQAQRAVRYGGGETEEHGVTGVR